MKNVICDYFKDKKNKILIIEHKKKNNILYDWPKVRFPMRITLNYLIINPFLIFADYEFEIDDVSIEDLTVKQSEDLLIYTIITMNEGDIKKMTTNLVAPIVINKENNKAKQVVLEKSKYNTKHKLFE